MEPLSPKSRALLSEFQEQGEPLPDDVRLRLRQSVLGAGASAVNEALKPKTTGQEAALSVTQSATPWLKLVVLGAALSAPAAWWLVGQGRQVAQPISPQVSRTVLVTTPAVEPVTELQADAAPAAEPDHNLRLPVRSHDPEPSRTHKTNARLGTTAPMRRAPGRASTPAEEHHGEVAAAPLSTRASESVLQAVRTAPAEVLRDPRPPESPQAAAASPEGALDADVELLAQAHQRLVSGQPREALILLGEHQQRFPRSPLSASRAATRALALCEAGEQVAGRRAARVFLHENPRSPFAARLRTTCALEEP